MYLKIQNGDSWLMLPCEAVEHKSIDFRSIMSAPDAKTSREAIKNAIKENAGINVVELMEPTKNNYGRMVIIKPQGHANQFVAYGDVFVIGDNGKTIDRL